MHTPLGSQGRPSSLSCRNGRAQCAAATEVVMTRFALMLLIAGLAFAGSPAPAQSQSQNPGEASKEEPPASASQDNRYTFHRIQDGFVRLDGRTGQVAQCGWSAAGWSCSAVPDERAALEAEIGRLQQENIALKKSLLTRGIALPGGVKADPPPVAQRPESTPSLKMPSEAEIDRALAFMKNVWRRLVEMMVELQRDIQRKS
jgi:hypothetical protein